MSSIFSLTLYMIITMSALAIITSRNAVHATLFSALNLASLALLYLTLDAPFVAMILLTIPVGAILTLLLLVTLLIQAEQLDSPNRLELQNPLAILLSLVLLFEGGFLVFRRMKSVSEWPSQLVQALPQTLADSSPQALARLLFQEYTLPLHMAALLLMLTLSSVALLVSRQKEHQTPVIPKAGRYTVPKTPSSSPSPTSRAHPDQNQAKERP